MRNKPQIILASGSPRRRELLSQIGLDFKVMVSGIDEYLPDLTLPQRRVEILAELKAADIAKDLDRGLILGADTIVVIDNTILEKPEDRDDARKMLGLLQGRKHEVFSGLCLINASNGVSKIGHKKTYVNMRTLSLDEIEGYIDSGEPMDKAGAYGIQGMGAAFITGVEGDYYNVVGLPVSLLVEFLKFFNITIFSA